MLGDLERLLHTDEPFSKLTENLIAPNGAQEKVELLANGQQVVVFGTHPDTRQPYRWHGGEPGTTAWQQLPYVREAEVRQFMADAARLLIEQFGYQQATERRKQNNGTGADWTYLTECIRASSQRGSNAATLH